MEMRILKLYYRGIRDVYYYIVGNICHWLWEERYLSWLIPFWIIRRYNKRLEMTDKVCLGNGACNDCGCDIPELLFTDKRCSCYKRIK